MTTTTVWNQARLRNPGVEGWYTSKDGLAALERRGVLLHPYSPFGPDNPMSSTDVKRYGRLVGIVQHPLGHGRPFESYARVYVIDSDTKHSHTVSVGSYLSFDDAVGAILRQHQTWVPRPRAASTVYRHPDCRSRVSRSYTGKNFTPTSGMSDSARLADSTATRIRMNATKIDPVTGEKIVRPATDTGLYQPVTVSRLKTIYRGMFTVHHKRGGDLSIIDRHLGALAMSPEHHHRLVADYMSASSTGGLHVGNKKAIEMKGAESWFTHSTGGTILKDRPNHRVGGVYYGSQRQLILPDDSNSASVSTGSHELGHALDAAYGARLSGTSTCASHLPFFQQVYNEVTHTYDDSDAVLNPYYTDRSTGNGPKEMWAEGYAAWLHGRDQYRTADEQAILIGHEIGAAPDDKLRVGRILQNYFDIQDEKMREMV